MLGHLWSGWPVLCALLDLSLLVPPFHSFSWSHDSCCSSSTIPFYVFTPEDQHTVFPGASSPTRLPPPCGWEKIRLSQPSKPVASASPANLLEMQNLGPHLLNQELWAWDPVISAVRSPSGDSRAPSGVRTGLLLGPASTLGAWLWEVSTDELFRTPS